MCGKRRQNTNNVFTFRIMSDASAAAAAVANNNRRPPPCGQCGVTQLLDKGQMAWLDNKEDDDLPFTVMLCERVMVPTVRGEELMCLHSMAYKDRGKPVKLYDIPVHCKYCHCTIQERYSLESHAVICLDSKKGGKRRK